MISTLSATSLARAQCRRPDLIEQVLVIGEHPTLSDLVVSDAKDPYRLPDRALTVALHPPSGEDHRTLVVGEHSADDDAKRRARQIASCDEVAQDLIPAPIVASYCAAPRHVPRDVLAEHRAHVLLVAAGVEAILGVVKLADQAGISMRLRHPAQYRDFRRSRCKASSLRRLTRTDLGGDRSRGSGEMVIG